jgi:hypothetical protein
MLGNIVREVFGGATLRMLYNRVAYGMEVSQANSKTAAKMYNVVKTSRYQGYLIPAANNPIVFSGETSPMIPRVIVTNKENRRCKRFAIHGIGDETKLVAKKIHRNRKTNHWEEDRRECKRLHLRRKPWEVEIKAGAQMLVEGV